jgi:predicted DNA-binding transcriptional regulator AlpA
MLTNTSARPSRVLTYAECCQRAAIVRRTFERLLACGEGPTVLHLSPRRRGVLESDFEAWLRSRRRPAPGDAASSAEARCPMGLQNEDPPLGSPPVRSTSERPPQGTAPGKRGRPAGAKPISATQVCAKAASSAEAV